MPVTKPKPKKPKLADTAHPAAEEIMELVDARAACLPEEERAPFYAFVSMYSRNRELES